jgi:hypothetical protein
LRAKIRLVGEATDYEELIAIALTDDRVLGLVLTGSRGRGPFARDDSDWDVRLVVRDDAWSEAAAAFATDRGSRVETVVLSLTAFEQAAEIGAADEWDRYSYSYAQVVVDKLDGRIGELVKGKGVLPADEAAKRAELKLDEYINSYYRSVKNLAGGLAVASHLDAAESVASFLAALFAMYGRVRPFNKFLVWELREHPLGETAWAHGTLMPRLQKIISTGDIAEQQQLFRDLERLAREHGLGEVIDRWEPDVPMLRRTPVRLLGGEC